MTFMAWLRFDDPGYVLAKHKSASTKNRCWSVYVDNDAIKTYGGEIVTLPDGTEIKTPTLTLTLPNRLLRKEGETPFLLMQRLRHHH